jgi:hypothetical protein
VGVAGGIVVAVQRAVRRGVVLAKVKDPALGRPDRAESGVAGAAVANGFAACSILLVGVGETDVSPCLHVIRRALGGGCPLDGRAAEGGVLEAKRFTTSPVGGWGEGVFAGSAKEVEPDGGEGGDGVGARSVWVCLEQGGESAEDCDVDGSDAGWSWVVIGPGFVEGSESVHIPGPVQPGILEAQSGELLPDGA